LKTPQFNYFKGPPKKAINADHICNFCGGFLVLSTPLIRSLSGEKLFPISGKSIKNSGIDFLQGCLSQRQGKFHPPIPLFIGMVIVFLFFSVSTFHFILLNFF
jgi:hypothetical protein